MEKGTIVEIWQRGIVSDSGVKFVCEFAQFYHDDRKVIIRGVKQLGNLQGKKLLIGLSVEDDNLIAKFPPSEKYTILINGQECVLSVIK
jgi:hypothetical protein